MIGDWFDANSSRAGDSAPSRRWGRAALCLCLEPGHVSVPGVLHCRGEGATGTGIHQSPIAEYRWWFDRFWATDPRHCSATPRKEGGKKKESVFAINITTMTREINLPNEESVPSLHRGETAHAHGLVKSPRWQSLACRQRTFHHKGRSASSTPHMCQGVTTVTS